MHCANTPSSMLDPSMHFDMIRAGVGLYGMQPCELSSRVMQLDPVMSVHARVTRVAHPAMGEGVGYGFTYRVPRTRVQICTLPIGYADGLSRTLSNRMDVLYRGERVRQVGNICMDQFMVAIQSNPAHEIPEAEYGDEMIIVGRDGDAEITMDEMAHLRGTINYEVACGFGMRLDKVYQLYQSRHNIVFGVGNPHARVVFIGEAPGRNEDLQGEPFVGAAGEDLNGILSLAGLKREDVYIANVLKCRPPGNRNPRPEEVLACSPFLREQIRSIWPDIIVTLGNPATHFVLKTEIGITKLRGRFHQMGHFVVMPTFHPAAALRNPAWQELLEEDFKMLGDYLERHPAPEGASE